MAGLLSLALLDQIDLRYADESAFSLEPNVPYGWIRVGQQYGLRSAKGGTLNVFGLLNLRGQLTSFTTTGRVNSEQIIEWMDDFAASLHQKTVVVLDNASWHCSAKIQQALKGWQQRGLHLYYLPPYCPHLNLIETLWRKMKHEWLRPQDYDSQEKLHDRILNILQNYGNDLFTIIFHHAS